ncbi:baseplate assembly protein [Pseudodesulfovibrio pelocollis]|uniref:baseplate assembly protein n=1 Tax=Pseudodesulfovibrio pelocollis TaxID=3051432 RepID=UPI00255AB715|nr:baseplate J/gp47 family protein [Pseudodesulfovibrio sp. SB368]
MSVDLSSLPGISFVETDPARIEAEGMALYEAVTGRTLSPGDPERLFVEALLYRLSLAHQEIEHAARMNLVSFARGGHLDHLGAPVDCVRLPASAARTTVRFTLEGALGFAATIPAGTRLTPGGPLLFATDETLTIAPGQTEGLVGATCLTAGAAGNGFLPGQIAKLVDPQAYVAGAVNTTLSAGGADLEGDERYRVRIMDAPRAFSVAGPASAYIWWGRTAHQDIADISFRSPSPGQVELRPLMTGGALPDQEILDAVLAICGADTIRADTDHVSVLAPEPVPYQVAASYWISARDAAVSDRIQDAARAAFDGWLVWQRSRLGRDIDPSELVHRLKSAGVRRVAVTLPGFTPIERHQVAVEDAGHCALIYGGLEDE